MKAFLVLHNRLLNFDFYASVDVVIESYDKQST